MQSCTHSARWISYSFLLLTRMFFFKFFLWNINKDVVPKKGEDVISYAQNFFHSPIKEKEKNFFHSPIKEKKKLFS